MNSSQITALSIFGALVLYVLSIGPVVVVGGHSNVYLRIYAPVIFLVDKVPALQPALEWYLGLWPAL
jgi:hypothetical protein